jgi:hypothetical protein
MNYKERINIQGYNKLKLEVYKWSKVDYFFFPFLIGSVRGYMMPFGEDMPMDEMKFWSLKVIRDLLIEDKIEIISVNKEIKSTKINSKNDIDKLLGEIQNEWDKLRDREPDMGDLVWLVAK